MLSVIYKGTAGYRRIEDFKVINKQYSCHGGNIFFGSLSKTNVIIGENNSGKSRFLRDLFCEDFYGLNRYEQFFKDTIRLARTKLYGPYGAIPEDKLTFVLDCYNKLRSEWLSNNTTFSSLLFDCSIKVGNTEKYYFPILRGSKNYKDVISKKLNDFLKSSSTIQNKDTVYHFLDMLVYDDNGLNEFDIYENIIRDEYFNTQNNVIKNQIITGGKLFNTVKKMLLDKESERKKVRDFGNFMKEEFFDKKEFEITPNENEKVLYVKIGNEEMPIYNWGDGIQQLITILFYLYIYKDMDNKIFFIEEPEIYLHPGMLRKLIEVINSDTFPNHQYFITTHSNAILDVSADINVKMSIFKFKKVNDRSQNDNKDFIIEQCSNGNVSLLNEIGVRNSSLFLSNCSIWVEGITDRLYVKHYLELYSKKFGVKSFREGLDYTFIEYGGSNLSHLNFSDDQSTYNINAKYINQKVFLIADGDCESKSKAKRNRKDELQNILGENFYELPVNEIENLISQQVLQRVLIKQNPDAENVIKEKFVKTRTYAKEHLGKYIDKMFVNNEIKKYSAQSGTIKDKLQFCNDAILSTKDFDDLSGVSKNLVEQVYNFIKYNNK